MLIVGGAMVAHTLRYRSPGRHRPRVRAHFVWLVPIIAPMHGSVRLFPQSRRQRGDPSRLPDGGPDRRLRHCSTPPGCPFSKHLPGSERRSRSRPCRSTGTRQRVHAAQIRFKPAAAGCSR